LAGEHTRGGCCGLIESNVGNITRSDGSVKVRLKILPDKPRGSAWRPSARGVNCPVKSGKSMSDTMTQKLRLTPDTSYMLGIYRCNRGKRIELSSSDDDMIARFAKLAMDEFGIEPNKIIIDSEGKVKKTFFYNSTMVKRFEKALERRVNIFKYANAYSGNYFAALFDCNGGKDAKGIFLKGMDSVDEVVLERLNIHTDKRGSKDYLANQSAFITLIKDYSLRIASIIH
jgi:hypothetical protein